MSNFLVCSLHTGVSSDGTTLNRRALAGVAEMPYLRFLPFSICGAIGWVFLMTMLGYELGSVPFVRRYFDKVILVIIVVSLLPTLLEVIKSRRAPAARASR